MQGRPIILRPIENSFERLPLIPIRETIKHLSHADQNALALAFPHIQDQVNLAQRHDNRAANVRGQEYHIYNVKHLFRQAERARRIQNQPVPTWHGIMCTYIQRFLHKVRKQIDRMPDPEDFM